MAVHVFGWIAGVCILGFVGVGLWMTASVWWTSFRAPTDEERSSFTARRSRVPFWPWFGLGLTGVVAAAIALALR
jgi:uncharacterized membrane protein